MQGAEKQFLDRTLSLFVEVEDKKFWLGQKQSDKVFQILLSKSFIPIARDFEYVDQYNDRDYYFPTICSIISCFLQSLKISSDRLIFLGSSAGGFTSLMMAATFPGSFAFVLNPQTNLLNYRPFYRQVLSQNFSGITIEEAQKKLLTRFSVSAYCKSINYIPNFYYIQNINDRSHYARHFLPFFREIYEILQKHPEFQPRIHNELYVGKPGHTVIPKQYELERISSYEKTISQNL